MTPQRRIKTSFITKLLLVALVLLIIAAVASDNQGQGATQVTAKRCPTTASAKSVAYHCYAAYPEAFYVTGFTQSTYRLAWKVTCAGRSIGKSRNVGGIVNVIVNQITQPAAYRLMSGSDVCKIDVQATRVRGNSPITLSLIINVNHPPPVRN